MGTDSLDGLSVQEHFYPQMNCFGCGPANPDGLRIRSFVQGDSVVAEFSPKPEHDNGMGFLNGGIICTVLDCHSAAAVVTLAQERGWPLDAGTGYVTAGLAARFARPTPLDQRLHLRAWIVTAEPTQIEVEAELTWGGKVRAHATSIWKPSRARPHGIGESPQSTVS